MLAPDLWDEDWLDREVGEIYDRVMAGEEELVPADQVFDEIRAEIAARAEHAIEDDSQARRHSACSA